jgi:hypothetical protein
METELQHSYEPFSMALTQVTMGIDAFERARHGGDGLLDSEGLVPIYLGGDLLNPRHYSDWVQVGADLDTLAAQAEQVEPQARREFARAMLRSLRAAVTLFSGGTLSYAAKVTDLVGAAAGPVPEQEIEEIRDALDALLRRQGFGSGTLAARIGRWEDEHALAPAELERTFRDLMAQGKTRTAARVFDTGDFSMALNPVRDVPYTARCAFDAGVMDLNVDLNFTRAAIKHLVAHEVYPGHATQLLLTRAKVLDGSAHPETLLCTANTVLGCVQEGIADEGVTLVDWCEDNDDLVHLQLRRLRSAVQTSAAWYLMADGWSAQAVSEYLRDKAAGQEAWIQGRLRMAAHPFRGAFIASYWTGARAVRRVFERTPREHFPAFVDYLYANAHSPQSLDMFCPAPH